MKQVLIFTYLQRHLKKFIPLINELMKTDGIEIHLLLMTQEERQIAQANGFPCCMLDEFTPKKRNFDMDLAWGLEPLINAIDAIKPDLFIAIEVNLILRNAIRHCKQKRIPNLVIQHGTPNRLSVNAFAPFEGDLFLAWGEFTREFLVRHHVDPAKIVITGGMPFDRTLSLAPDRKKIAVELGIDPDKKWILFTTQGVGAGNCPSEEEIRTGVVEVAKEIKRYPDCIVLYQVHPGQAVDHVREMIEPAENPDACVIKYGDTEELIACSDAMITFFSTTAIDAVLLNKPLLLINLTDDKDFYPFTGMGAAFSAFTKEDIPVQLGRIIHEGAALLEYQKKAASYVSYGNDGKSRERVLRIIHDVLQSGKM